MEQFEKDILNIIKNERNFKFTFEELIARFEDNFAKLESPDNHLEIAEYFSEGESKAREKLFIKGWLKEKKDFKGIYVFLNYETPFYVGISKNVIKRIIQHTQGNHKKATLAYNIYKRIIGKKSKDINIETEFKKVKNFLLNQKMAFVPIDDDVKLALFEIYCSIKFNTAFNDFKTH